ncbi:TPA: DNA invertase, partial [Escherichia coli]|nr:DNA invertase [Escherichia coli]
MLHHCISATPLEVWLMAMEQVHQQAMQSLP